MGDTIQVELREVQIHLQWIIKKIGGDTFQMELRGIQTHLGWNWGGGGGGRGLPPRWNWRRL